MQNILITGISGLVGRKLAQLLSENGYVVTGLSRKSTTNSNYKTFKWDYQKGYIDNLALENIDAIIHLAGENIGKGRWTKTKKKKIISSRVDSANFLLQELKNRNKTIDAFISASAIGYYESYYNNSPVVDESFPPGNSFTSKVCVLWEEAADSFADIGARVVKVRTALVQDKNDIALKKISLSAKFGILPVMGKGKQPYSWIHIDDLCKIYLYAINNDNFYGSVNAVAPEIINNYDYIKNLKTSVFQRAVIIKIPAFLLNTVFGEKSEILLKGTNVKSHLFNHESFTYKFKNSKSAFIDIFS